MERQDMNNLDAIEMQRQAEQWFARMLASDCEEGERTACARWRAQSPAHEAAFQEVEEFWRRSLQLRDSPAMAEAYRAVQRQTNARAGRSSRYWAPLVGVAVALLAVSFLAIKLQQAAPGQELRFHTAVGEQRTITLTDGSTLVLDTDTALVARYSGAQRLIELETGQASFNVASEPKRPFRVQAGGGAVTAVGTHFLVRTGTASADTTVTLLEGRVLVEGPQAEGEGHAPAILSPRDQLRFSRNGTVWAKTQVDLDTASAWTRGNLRIRDGRLADLLAEMNRYSTTQLRLAEPALGNLRISGTFRTGEPESLVRLLEHGWPVRAVPEGAHAILLVHRPAAK